MRIEERTGDPSDPTLEGKRSKTFHVGPTMNDVYGLDLSMPKNSQGFPLMRVPLRYIRPLWENRKMMYVEGIYFRKYEWSIHINLGIGKIDPAWGLLDRLTEMGFTNNCIVLKYSYGFSNV